MNFSEKLLNLIVETLVRKKIKKQFGGNLKAFVSGGGVIFKLSILKSYMTYQIIQK